MEKVEIIVERVNLLEKVKWSKIKRQQSCKSS